MSRLRLLPQPLDRAVAVAGVVLLLLTGLLLFGGDRTSAQVRRFSWAHRQVSAADAAMIFDFNRPMDAQSVEANLRFEPDLPGRLSWAGRRMAYTPDLPPRYGTQYQVRLATAKDRFGRPMARPFESQFNTAEPQFLYLGSEGAEVGRLIAHNLTASQRLPLTPANLVVSEFKAYPDGQRVLFSAAERSAVEQGTDAQAQQLYRVNLSTGTVELLLDSRDYQLLRFDLSADGQSIVVQRFDRRAQQPKLDQPLTNLQSSLGLWLKREGQSDLSLISNQASGEFLITPDSSALVIAQGSGQTLLPLMAQAQALEFLPRYGMVLSFTADGTQAAMVQFSADDQQAQVRELFLVSTQDQPRKLLSTSGNFRACQFDLNRTHLYCVLTRLAGSGYDEHPALVAVELKSGQTQTLLELDQRTDLNFSLAPDQRSLLYDRVTLAAAAEPGVGGVRSLQGEPVAASTLWQLPLQPLGSPVALNLPGLRPSWLP